MTDNVSLLLDVHLCVYTKWVVYYVFITQSLASIATLTILVSHAGISKTYA